MLEIILLILFLISVTGIVVTIKRKVPLLMELSPQTLEKVSIKRDFSRSLILQKILSKFRILILKTDHKTNEWLKNLREKSRDNETKFSDSYWDKLRK